MLDLDLTYITDRIIGIVPNHTHTHTRPNDLMNRT